MSNRFVAAVLTACALSSTASAGTLTKDPDLGAYWNPVGPTGSYVYANSFVADGNADVTDLGAWLISNYGPGLGSTVAFEVWGSVGGNPANGPDASNVIASTGLLNLGGTFNLDYYSAAPAFTGPLVAGQTYWFAINAIGGSGGSWMTGGHTQNSQQVDNGTFWYSNDAAGVFFDGMALTPELAFSVTTGVAVVLDADGDGLEDADEITYGTDPNLADTDGDGLDDGDEVLGWGTDPLVMDSDGGGCIDGDETNSHGTDPLVFADDLCADTDGDGFDGFTDCNDDNPSVYPGQAEITCDGVDNDCSPASADVIDLDLDGVSGCSDDCDDTDAGVGAGQRWFTDADGDGFGDTSDGGVVACVPPSPDSVLLPSDCDDANPLISPAATEVCDPADVDEDCDRLADDASADDAGKTTFYADSDGDGFGDASDPGELACDAPDDAVTDATDCDDNDADSSPDGTEVPYDGIDQDCADGDLVDVDGDGYDGVAGGDDCDDNDANVHPGVTEVADGVDQDCNGAVDDGTAAFDDDVDGFSEDAGDCDDADSAVNPDAAEVADDGVDNNCDGAIDEVEGGEPNDTDDTDSGSDDAKEGCGCDGSGGGLRAGLPMLLAVFALRRARKARATV